MKLFGKSFVAVLLIVCVVPSVSAGNFKEWLLGSGAKAPEPVQLDVSSAQCMKCHNSKDSGHITVKHADSPMQFTASGLQTNHPVGMHYGNYALNQPASFRSRATLNPKIMLAGGRVTCISCHEQKEKDVSTANAARTYGNVLAASGGSLSGLDMCTSKKTLTVGPKTSDLCMSCHTM